MNYKQTLILIGTIFIAFVGYKVISSSIQENKEKSVLQEKARLDELAKEPLNQCIANIDKQAAYEIKSFFISAQDMSSPEFQTTCLKPTGHGLVRDLMIARGEVNLQEYCRPPTLDEINAQDQKILDKAKIDKEECYKQYK